ncbi:prolyl oligopeptidase family serine peptidase [Labrenzia sp. R4_1]|uniref:alpha/beta hydrolase n=1 Tax=Labrenzia sp. R4_1 TaxID=2821106 RepID=UPI001ADA0867|nr:prolyl oligopeptidase family serine peptidase [Labrenzia sp. R4_1]MBO9423475.1 prolyl oligopeptidase family serine peptidase [Labrenzia sp. R4_1]
MTSSSFNPSLDGPRLAPLSGGAAEQLVVILHGYGADGADLIDLGRAWQQALPDAAFVAPNAPEPLPFEAFGGRQWFALEERTPREYEIGAQAAQPALDRFLDAELISLGLNDAALALVGFSQGAMMTFQAGLRRKTPPACLMAYSGLLPGVAALPVLLAPPPTLIVHGADDDVVPAYHLEAARTALAQAGVTVQTHCLDDLGHGIDERGLILGRLFLEKTFL